MKSRFNIYTWIRIWTNFMIITYFCSHNKCINLFDLHIARDKVHLLSPGVRNTDISSIIIKHSGCVSVRVASRLVIKYFCFVISLLLVEKYEWVIDLIQNMKNVHFHSISCWVFFFSISVASIFGIIKCY